MTTSYRQVCPVVTLAVEAGAEIPAGHGGLDGYTVGGALSHATGDNGKRAGCQPMADALELGVTVRTASRGPQSADDFRALAKAKLASRPVATAAAEPEYVYIDGKRYAKA